MNKLSNPNSGQALLVTLLIMAVVLTIGLSLISRSITDIRISTQTEDAARAYSAAEAGIEEALIGGSSGTTTFEETGSKYSVAVSGLGEGETEYVFPQTISANEIQTFWFANSSDLAKVYDKSQVEVYWGNPGVSGEAIPALEVSVYYRDGTADKVGRIALDPYGNSNSRTIDPSFCNRGEVGIGNSECTNVNTLTLTGGSLGGKNFQFFANLDISNFRGGTKMLLFARLRMLYSTVPQALGVKAATGGSGGLFAAQGTKIESTGQSGQATRKVEVVRSNPAPPEIFDFVLYSGGDLVK